MNIQFFQSSVANWVQRCFGYTIAADPVERNDRFLEESLELVQSLGYTPDRAHALVDYVFSRPVGDPRQEMGGVGVTLAALAAAQHLHMEDCFIAELQRIDTNEMIYKIRAKQAAKPTGSALPIAHPGLTWSLPGLGFGKSDFVRAVAEAQGIPVIDVPLSSDKYPVSDWKYEVANGDTWLGYAHWVAAQTEMNELPDHK